MGKLQWDNVITYSQKERLCKEAEAELKKLESFLEKNRPFLCLVKDDIKIHGRHGGFIGIRIKSLQFIPAEFNYFDKEQSFDYPCNVSGYPHHDLCERLNKYHIYAQDVTRKYKQLYKEKEIFLERARKGLGKEGLKLSLSKLEELQKMTEQLLEMIDISIEIRGINGVLHIDHWGNVSRCGDKNDIKNFFEIYGITPQSIEKAIKDLRE